MPFVIDLKTFGFDPAQITHMAKNILEKSVPKELEKAGMKAQYAWIDKAAKTPEVQAAVASANKAFTTLLKKYEDLDNQLLKQYRDEVTAAPAKIKVKYKDAADKKHIPALRAELKKSQEIVKKTLENVAKKVKVK